MFEKCVNENGENALDNINRVRCDFEKGLWRAAQSEILEVQTIEVDVQPELCANHFADNVLISLKF